MSLPGSQAAVQAAFCSEIRTELGPKYDEFGQRCLEMIYERWAEAIHNLRRAMSFAVLLALVFLLLEHSNNSEFTLGPLQTGNLAAVLTLIPAIVSFLLFEAIDLTVASAFYGEAADALIEILRPPVYANNLHRLLEPTPGFAWGIGITVNLARGEEGTTKALLNLVSIRLTVATILGVIGFLAYAYISLYGSSHTSVVAVSLSLIFTVFNVIRIGLQWASYK